MLWRFLALTFAASLFVAIKLPNVQIRKHSKQASEEYLRQLSAVEYNHDGAFLICVDSPIDTKYVINHRRVRIGQGGEDFRKATRFLLNFDMMNDKIRGGLAWADVVRLPEDSTRDVRVGDVVGTLVNCYKLIWSLNPCRITCVGEYKVSGGIGAQIAFSTIQGHLLEGEERFRVFMDAVDGQVFFDMKSYSRGHGIIGAVGFPFVMPLQKKFFDALERSFLNLMRTGCN